MSLNRECTVYIFQLTCNISWPYCLPSSGGCVCVGDKRIRLSYVGLWFMIIFLHCLHLKKITLLFYELLLKLSITPSPPSKHADTVKLNYWSTPLSLWLKICTVVLAFSHHFWLMGWFRGIRNMVKTTVVNGQFKLPYPMNGKLKLPQAAWVHCASYRYRQIWPSNTVGKVNPNIIRIRHFLNWSIIYYDQKCSH